MTPEQLLENGYELDDVLLAYEVAIRALERQGEPPARADQYLRDKLVAEKEAIERYETAPLFDALEKELERKRSEAKARK